MNVNVNIWLYAVLSSARAWDEECFHDIIRIKQFCASKDTTKKVKGQPTEWEKSFKNHTSDTVYLKYIKNYYNSIIKRTQLKNGLRV